MHADVMALSERGKCICSGLVQHEAARLCAVHGVCMIWHASMVAGDAGVMAFSEVMADSSALGRFSLELYDSGRCMRLDAAAQRALNVMRQRTDANDAFSLYGLMNRARTAMAKRLLKVCSSLLEMIFVLALVPKPAEGEPCSAQELAEIW